jgi:2-isopropylmalate synthase
MIELGIDFSSEEELNEVFFRFKQLADKKHDIFDEDLQALISEASIDADEEIKFIALKVCSETGEIPRAYVTLSINNREVSADSEGSGAVDASLRAVDQLVDNSAALRLYSVNNITDGTDAQGEVTVRLEQDGKIVNGLGSDTDIVIASAKAYINAINKIKSSAVRSHPQKGTV